MERAANRCEAGAGGEQSDDRRADVIYASEGECLLCHTEAAARSLGLLETRTRVPRRVSTDRPDAHQYVTLNAVDASTAPIANPEEHSSHIPDPTRTSGTAERAGARVPAHQLLTMPSPDRPNAHRHRSRLTNSTPAPTPATLVPGLSDLGIANVALIPPGASGPLY